MTTSTSVAAADGVPLHVEIDGPDAAPVTVVLVHGWTLDRRTWGPVAGALASGAQPVRVVRYDHRGHGLSAAVDPASMTIEQLADDLAEVIAATAPEGPLVLGGHSMGGMALMALAERHPQLLERAAGIVLVATASGGLQPIGVVPARWADAFRRIEQRLYGTRWWAARSAIGSRRLMAPGTSWLLLGRDASAEARRVTAETVAACRPLTWSGFRPALDSHERDAALAAFSSIPTVLLVGDRDRLTPVPLARHMARALASASFTIFPDAGHMLPLERVSGVADRIRMLAMTAAPASR